ncbi:site-specific integrase, partial [Desulfatitalea sp. M08but]|nr:site-specific integrase [Desulfatitalea alkaliphila]
MNDCHWNPKDSSNVAPDRYHPAAVSGGQPRLLDQVRNVIRCKHYSIRTEQSYIDWIKGARRFRKCGAGEKTAKASCGVHPGEGFGSVYLPYALERKYAKAGRSWPWQYLFPATRRSVAPRSGVERRHPISETVPQRAVKNAIRQCGVI